MGHLWLRLDRALAALLTSAAALALLTPSAAGAATTPPTVDVYPTAGTPTASPETQITFRGAAPAAMGRITVVGSSTGSHSGRLVPHSDGRGASFLPDTPFRQGERVRVRAGVPLTGAAGGVVKFGIARYPSDSFRHGGKGDPGGDPPTSQHFHSRRDLVPPSVQVLRRTPAAADGDIFLGVKAGAGPDGPLILDAEGRVVWFHPLRPGLSPYDFRAQSYRGQPVLTWWEGRVVGGKGQGLGLVYDSSYRLVARVRAGNGYSMDQHEFAITPEGTALIDAYVPTKWNTAAAGGSRHGFAWDSVVQEIDIATGLVLFEWHSLGHVPVSDTYDEPGFQGILDYFHVNSIDREPNGDLLLSARAANALFEVERHTGRVLWQLGGRRSDFRMGRGTSMIGQHQATRQPDGTIAVFDNGGALGPPAPSRASRAIVLQLDLDRKVVKLRRVYRHPDPPLHSLSQGSMQLLPNGNVFVSWGGSNHFLTGFAADGSQVFDARLSTDDTYRAYRLPWSATPATRPAVVAGSSGGQTLVWASWNGATEVASWEVLAGDSRHALSRVAVVPRTGFETRIAFGSPAKLVRVRALGASGQVLASSAVVRPRGA